MGRIDVEKAAAIGAQHLDGFLSGHRPHGDGLSRSFHRDGFLVGLQSLRHPSSAKEKGEHQRQRQQHVNRGAGRVNPEIADGGRLLAGKTANERHRHGDARRSGAEILDRQRCHLDQIAERLLAAVCLPVGVGYEAHGGIERQVRRHGRGVTGSMAGAEVHGVERQQSLEALNGVNKQEADQGKSNSRCGILRPALFGGFADAA